MLLATTAACAPSSNSRTVTSAFSLQRRMVRLLQSRLTEQLKSTLNLIGPDVPSRCLWAELGKTPLAISCLPERRLVLRRCRSLLDRAESPVQPPTIFSPLCLQLPSIPIEVKSTFSNRQPLEDAFPPHPRTLVP